MNASRYLPIQDDDDKENSEDQQTDNDESMTCKSFYEIKNEAGHPQSRDSIAKSDHLMKVEDGSVDLLILLGFDQDISSNTMKFQREAIQRGYGNKQENPLAQSRSVLISAGTKEVENEYDDVMITGNRP